MRLKTFYLFNEGLADSSIIKNITEILFQRIKKDLEQKIYHKKYKIKFILSSYKDDKVIGDFVKKYLFFVKNKKLNPDILIVSNFWNIYNHQTGEVINGYFNTKNLDISIKIENKDILEVKNTLSHEVKHMYDFIVSDGKVDLQKNVDYSKRITEIYAKLYSFISSDKFEKYDNIEEAINDFKRIYPNLQIDKKIKKIIYKAFINKSNNSIEVINLKERVKRKPVSHALIQYLKEKDIKYEIKSKTVFIKENTDNKIKESDYDLLISIILKLHELGHSVMFKKYESIDKKYENINLKFLKKLQNKININDLIPKKNVDNYMNYIYVGVIEYNIPNYYVTNHKKVVPNENKTYNFNEVKNYMINKNFLNKKDYDEFFKYVNEHKTKIYFNENDYNEFKDMIISDNIYYVKDVSKNLSGYCINININELNNNLTIKKVI